MSRIMLMVLAYSYMHYGTMLLLWAMGVYTGNRKAVLLDMIPFYWVIKETRNFFRKE